jgi:hypothetical protein
MLNNENGRNIIGASKKKKYMYASPAVLDFEFTAAQKASITKQKWIIPKTIPILNPIDFRFIICLRW